MKEENSRKKTEKRIKDCKKKLDENKRKKIRSGSRNEMKCLSRSSNPQELFYQSFFLSDAGEL